MAGITKVIALLFCVSCVYAPAPIPSSIGVCEKGPSGTSLCVCSGDEVHCNSLGLTDVPVVNKFPPSTKILSLPGNQIKSIPRGAFRTLVNLTYLDLSTLPLESIEDNAFIGLSRVTEIVLAGFSQSKLSTLTSRTFAHLWALEKMNLQSNPIRYVPADAFMENVALARLYIGTSLQCNCDLVPFKRWVDSSSIEVGGQCGQYPDGNANQRISDLSVSAFGTCPDVPRLSLRCVICNGVSSEKGCLRSEVCNAGQDTCMTKYVQSVDGTGRNVTLVTKTCTTESTCSAIGQDNPSKCGMNPLDSVCVSCCKGDFCNRRVFEFGDKPVLCAPGSTIHELKGTATWITTPEGSTVQSSCQFQLPAAVSYVSRICDIGGIWSSPDYDSCPSKLDQLLPTDVTSDNVDEVASNLTALTGSADSFDSDDFTTAVNILDKVLKFPRESIASDVVEIFSNLMQTDTLVLKQAEPDTVRLLELVDLFSADVTFTGTTLSIQKTNVAVEIEKVTASNFDGKTFQTGADESSISLPRTLFGNVNTSTVNRIQFVYYATDRFFQAVENRSQRENISINSRVLAASVGRLSLRNLVDNVSMVFSHVNANASDPQCVFWDVARQAWSGEGCGVKTSSNQSTTCECSHLTNFALLMDVYGDTVKIDESNRKALSIISYIGCGISSFGLLLTIITYLMFRALRRDNPSKILINLCFALLGVNIIFITGTIDTTNVIGCKISAALLHYFLLASFTWMAIEAFYMYLALVLVFRTYYSRLILKCSLVGWGVPLVAVIITVAVNTENYTVLGDPSMQGSLCWLDTIPFYCAFLAPVVLILIVNFVAFGLVIRQLTKLSSNRAAGQADPNIVARLRGAISVVVLLGLTWVFALFGIGDAAVVFSYLFAIFNSLQGLMLFIFYCLLKTDVQHAWMRKCPCCPNPPDSRTMSKVDYRRGSESNSSSSGTGSTSLNPQPNKMKAAAVAVQVSNRLVKHEKERLSNAKQAVDSGDINLNVSNSNTKV